VKRPLGVSDCIEHIQLDLPTLSNVFANAVDQMIAMSAYVGAELRG
jgi:hypothetical protein